MLLAAATLLFLALAPTNALGGSATWNLNANGNWFTATNWTPATVPDGPADTATFDVSNSTGVSLDYYNEVNGIVFNAGASAFTTSVSAGADYEIFITISGVGITNNSGITQNFVIGFPDLGNEVDGNVIQFTNSATAGNLTAFTNIGGATRYGPENGVTAFYDTSSAGTGTFTNNGSNDYFSAVGGLTVFLDSATADNATLIADGCAVSGASGGSTTFQNTSTAGNATLIANGGSGGGLGGTILFEGDSTGDTARVEVFGNGTLDIGAHNAPGVTVGSIEGDGMVILGARNLTVGSNGRSTTFSGMIQDTGSVTKLGQGRLTLSGANTYTGGTTVTAGGLDVSNVTGSGTGTGIVQVNAGSLRGKGIIAGAVMVGTGSGPGAFLAPGQGAGEPSTLTIQSALTFDADSTYTCKLNTRKAKADQVVANGVTIESGSQFNLNAVANKKLTAGTVFTAISNTSATPISGTLSNLPDGSTLTVGQNSYQISYSGGDGNDLTLTVVQ